jgi:hypothetical protein
MASISPLIGNKRRSSEIQNVGQGKWKRVTEIPGFKPAKATLLSDSICQRFLNCMTIKVQVVHGGTMAKLASYILNGTSVVLPYRSCIIHYGSNDMNTDSSPPDCADSIVRSLDRAVSAIRSANLDIILGVSGILPRPKDVNNAPMREVRAYANVAIKIFCTTTGIPYFASESFLTGKHVKPGVPLFIKDGIHLSDQGQWHFQNYLEGKVGRLLGPPPPSRNRQQPCSPIADTAAASDTEKID